MTPAVTPFRDSETNTWTYVVRAPGSRDCVVIDPVLTFDPGTGSLAPGPLEQVCTYLGQEQLNLVWILETHVHADHLSAAQELRSRCGGQIAIGAQVVQVQQVFAGMFNAGAGFSCDGSQFDHLCLDGETLVAGSLAIEVLHTPGHTPACVSYLIGDAVFVGDTLFMPDYGTARCDFPGGDARKLHASIQRLLALPDNTSMFLCHDYLPEGRSEYQCQTTVAAQRANNIHLLQAQDAEAFVALREGRDADLHAPRLLLPAVQFNMRGGALPPAETNGSHYLKTPVRLSSDLMLGSGGN